MIDEKKYEKHGLRVTRLAETKTGYMAFEVFVPLRPAGVYIVKDGKMNIPAIPNASTDEAEMLAKAITLCVQAQREMNTGMKKTCLDL
jgi:hypothetical protein